MAVKTSITLPGTVEKVIHPPSPNDPEKAQIAVEGADDLYRDLRVENTLIADDGSKVRLTKGAEVEVTVEADAKATKKLKK